MTESKWWQQCRFNITPRECLPALISLLLVLLSGSVLSAPHSPERGETGNLMPVPQTVEWKTGYYSPSDGRLVLAIDGGDIVRLDRALRRWDSAVSLETRPVITSMLPASAASSANFRIMVSNAGGRYPMVDTDESYRLSISHSGIIVEAATTFGAMHALQTLRQLATACNETICFPLVRISDRPEFAVRGLLIDSVRHWITVDAIKRQLDGMATVKLNFLHWHLSDDQGFRVESLALPRLHEIGSDGNFYTQVDIQEIVEYAADRGIRIMPEFDLPGHSRSWQMAYPELASRPGSEYHLYKTERIFSDPIDPTRESSYALITTVVGEMSQLFPDQYFHLGGDEVSFDAWEQNDEIRGFMKSQGLADFHALQTYFVNRYARIIKKAGRIPVAWADVVSPKLEKGVVVQHWSSTDTSAAALSHPALVSMNYYMDHMRSAESHYRNDPRSLTLEGMTDARLHENIQGVVATAWSEVMDSRNIDLCLWPRSAAIAESLWSDADYVASADMDDVYRRMEGIHQRLLQQGFTQRLVQQAEWRELAPNADADTLQALADIVEPVPFYPIRDWSVLGGVLLPSFFAVEIADEPITLAPFTRVLAYESLPAWHFNRDVSRFLADPTNDVLRQSLLTRLEKWSELHDKLLPTIQASSQLQELGIEKLTEVVSRVAKIVIVALNAEDDRSSLTSGDLAYYQDVVSTHEMLPLTYSVDTLVQGVRGLFHPLALRRNSIAILPGIRMLLESIN